MKFDPDRLEKNEAHYKEMKIVRTVNVSYDLAERGVQLSLGSDILAVNDTLRTSLLQDLELKSELLLILISKI